MGIFILLVVCGLKLVLYDLKQSTDSPAGTVQCTGLYTNEFTFLFTFFDRLCQRQHTHTSELYNKTKCAYVGLQCWFYQPAYFSLQITMSVLSVSTEHHTRAMNRIEERQVEMSGLHVYRARSPHKHSLLSENGMREKRKRQRIRVREKQVNSMVREAEIDKVLDVLSLNNRQQLIVNVSCTPQYLFWKSLAWASKCDVYDYVDLVIIDWYLTLVLKLSMEKSEVGISNVLVQS